MQLLSIAQLFGDGVTQDENILVIQKYSLLGLTPSINNTAESLLVALLLTALHSFKGAIKDEFNQPITDEFNQAITFDNSEVFDLLKIIDWPAFRTNRGNQPYIINQIIVFNYVPN